MVAFSTAMRSEERRVGKEWRSLCDWSSDVCSSDLKHILCEKPVGRDPQETIESAAAAHAAGVLTFVGYNYRWAPLVQYARQLITDGKLGRVTHYHGRFLNGYEIGRASCRERVEITV